MRLTSFSHCGSFSPFLHSQCRLRSVFCAYQAKENRSRRTGTLLWTHVALTINENSSGWNLQAERTFLLSFCLHLNIQWNWMVKTGRRNEMQYAFLRALRTRFATMKKKRLCGSHNVFIETKLKKWLKWRRRRKNQNIAKKNRERKLDNRTRRKKHRRA